MARHQWIIVAGLAGGCSFESPPPSLGRPDADVALDGGGAPDVPPGAARVTSGLVALWRFDEGTGDRAGDSRNALALGAPMTPIPLPIADPARVTWASGGLRLDAPVRVGTSVQAHVSRDVLLSGAVTMEAWVAPASTSQGAGPLPGGLPSYALVLSLSPSYAYHNAMIAQVGDRWQGRVLTAATTANALPVIETPAGAVTGAAPVHLALVASATERVLYVDGVPHRAPAPGTGIGPLNAPAPALRWFDYFPVSIGQERDTSETRPWLGTIWLAAIYDRALSTDEIRQNLAARHDCADC